MIIKRYLSLFWRWAWLILLGTAVATTVATIVNKNIVPTYQASTLLFVDLALDKSDETPIDTTLNSTQTYAQLLPTQSILQETIERLGVPLNTAQMADILTISVPDNTHIIVVQIEDTQPERAALIANELSQVFIDQHETRENQRYAQPIASLQQRLNALETEIDDLKNQINQIGPPKNPQEESAYVQLGIQLENGRNRQTEVYNRLNELHITQAAEKDNVIVIEPARVNRSPIRPKIFISLLWAIFLGALATAVIILIAERDGLDAAAIKPDSSWAVSEK